MICLSSTSLLDLIYDIVKMRASRPLFCGTTHEFRFERLSPLYAIQDQWLFASPAVEAPEFDRETKNSANCDPFPVECIKLAKQIADLNHWRYFGISRRARLSKDKVQRTRKHRDARREDKNLQAAR